MAIFSPSESPAIITKEVDLSGVVPNVQSTTGAIVGNFRWGPVNQVTKVSTETELAAAFGTPDTSNTGDFHQAAYFLRYSGDLRVIRTVTAVAKNAAFGTDTGVSFVAPAVLNDDSFDSQKGTIATTMTFLGKFPGVLGNSLKVEICPADATAFAGWTYSTSFDAAPGTSSYASDRGASLDEIHVVVLDEDGLFTGVKGTVLEAFPFVSLNSDNKNADGSTNYALDVINSASRYIKMASWAAPLKAVGNLAGSATTAAAQTDLTAVQQYSLSAGVDSALLTTSQYATGFSLVEDVDTVQVDFLIAPGLSSGTDQTTVVNNMVNIAQQTRKDCIVVASPPSSDVINAADPVTETVAGIASYTRSSYLVVDNNYLKVYDKYNDQYINIPAASSTAGIMAASDNNTAPWFSPAGQRRGNYLGITGLAYTPTKAQRDTLYKAGINPIANLPGQGILLFGDKTHLARPSAFDRINVRRLFLVVERAVALAARNVMFEFNDEFTRAEFVNIVEPFLREIKGRRGITDFRVVCDDSNNTAAVVDRNEFIANIFIKPARSINFVTLNFVAVRTGVDFEEVVGTV